MANDENDASPHPLGLLVSQRKGMGRDSMYCKLMEEGFEEIGQIDLELDRSKTSFIEGMLDSVKTINRGDYSEIRIIPAYMVHLSRFDLHSKDYSEMHLKHSGNNNCHIIYAKK